MEYNVRTKLMEKLDQTVARRVAVLSERRWGWLMLLDGGNQAPGTCRNASRSLAWLEERRPRRLARKDTVENVQMSGRLCHSPDGPTIHPEMMVMLVMCKPSGRSNGKADAGDTQLHCQAALMEWMWTTPLMTRRARACRATTCTWGIALIETQFSYSSNGCFVIGRVRISTP